MIESIIFLFVILVAIITLTVWFLTSKTKDSIDKEINNIYKNNNRNEKV
jgi:uncharacterized membrane protein